MMTLRMRVDAALYMAEFPYTDRLRFELSDYDRKLGVAGKDQKGNWRAVLFYETDNDAKIIDIVNLLLDLMENRSSGDGVSGTDTLSGNEHRA